MTNQEYLKRIESFGIKVGDTLLVKEYYKRDCGSYECITYHGDVTEVLDYQFNMNGNLSGAWVPNSLISSRERGGFFLIISINGVIVNPDDEPIYLGKEKK